LEGIKQPIVKDKGTDMNGTGLIDIFDEPTGLDAGQESQQSEDSRQSEAMSCLRTGFRISLASAFALR